MSSSTTSPSEVESTVSDLLACYGDGADGSSPSARQGRALLEAPADGPVTLVNLFKLRRTAQYRAGEDDGADAVSGQEAMMRYASVSGAALERAGGRFLVLGPVAGTLIGENEDWDAVAVGSYPNRRALLALFNDEAYRDAWQHRRAALDRQRVLVAAV
jgi:uncharacterized protein (DUF1330 family)